MEPDLSSKNGASGAPDAARDLMFESRVIKAPPQISLRLLSIAGLFTIGIFLVEATPLRAQAAVELVQVDAKVVAKGYRASKLIGTKVYNAKDEKIGTLDDLVIDGETVRFAVLQVGGFLGIGGKLVVVPYDHLSVDETGDKIVFGAGTKEQLTSLAGYAYKAIGTAPTRLISRVVPEMTSPEDKKAPSPPTGGLDKVVPPMKEH
jgi:sporulation protein YlmC with PRC-barrel domain